MKTFNDNDSTFVKQSFNHAVHFVQMNDTIEITDSIIQRTCSTVKGLFKINHVFLS